MIDALSFPWYRESKHYRTSSVEFPMARKSWTIPGEEVLVLSRTSSAGICKGLQWGWKGECRFEQELGCYANWKDNNRLSEDGCADELADEHSTSPHLDNTDPSPPHPLSPIPISLKGNYIVCPPIEPYLFRLHSFPSCSVHSLVSRKLDTAYFSNTLILSCSLNWRSRLSLDGDLLIFFEWQCRFDCGI